MVYRISSNQTPGWWLKRLPEVMWTLEHLDDLECDFSAVHRIDNIYALPGPKFFKFAYRLDVFTSVTQFRSQLAARKRAEQKQQGDPQGRDLYSTQPREVSSDDEFLKIMRMREGTKILNNDVAS